MTHALDRAQVRGRTQKAVLDEDRAITVRLQGIDAPELHYMRSIAKSKPKNKTPTSANATDAPPPARWVRTRPPWHGHTEMPCGHPSTEAQRSVRQ
jgi:endonuclease YncB( thermonuclease family)